MGSRSHRASTGPHRTPKSSRAFASCRKLGCGSVSGMSSHERFHKTLRCRLLAAALGGSALTPGCGEQAPTPTIPSGSAPLAGASTAAPQVARPAMADPCGTGSRTEQCFAPFTNARSVGTGQPAPPPPPSAYNTDGCLPKELVSNGCCVPAAGGPRFDGKQCCYDFCEGPCCGRPFLVGGQARVAPLRPTDDWLSRDLAPLAEAGALDARTARAIAEAWLADARMEHASVAAFGRFLLQLLGLGAPAAMVRDAAQAALDEERHAELCFTLAANIGGVALGPAALALEGALNQYSLGGVIAEVVLEGCAGETIAALLASRQLEGACEPGVRQALLRIAEDEARHAELAWRFVRWALDVGGEEARAIAADAFATAVRRFEPRGEPGDTCERDIDARAWRAFGRLAATERDETVRRALTEVVVPCARALLAGDPTAAVWGGDEGIYRRGSPVEGAA